MISFKVGSLGIQTLKPPSCEINAEEGDEQIKRMQNKIKAGSVFNQVYTFKYNKTLG